MINLELNNKTAPEKGKVLISDPFLEDSYFNRSVILLCDHNEEGSFGFVLNNYVDIDINELIPDFPTIETKMALGGPVKTSNVYYLHNVGNLIQDSEEIIPGIFVGGSFEDVKNGLISGTITEKNIRFFVGYSGWSRGQLNHELKEKSWLVAEITKEDVMNTDMEKLWKKTLEKQGKEAKIISQFPKNFKLN